MPPARTLPALLAGGLLGACEPGPDDSGPNDPCRSACTDAHGEQLVVSVPSDLLPSPVGIEFNPCQDSGAMLDGAPVVVVLPGGFKAISSPVAKSDRMVETRLGMVALYPSFPTDAGDFLSGKVGDYRGSGARTAAAVALAWAVGETEDTDGCTLEDRIPATISGQPPWLVGQSNGGNLALGLLADDSLDLPAMGGLVTFETPSSAQFVTLEVGSVSAPSPVYQDGSCSWDAVEGLICPMDYDLLGWDDTATSSDGHRGVAYFDLDGNGAFDDEVDDAVWGIRPEMDGERQVIYSPPMSQALRARGLAPTELLPQEETLEFWSLRDASRALTSAVARWPALPFMVLGTEIDHNLGIGDHAHVTGLADALQQAGATWVRVNPDTAYLEAVIGEGVEWEDNPANAETTPGDPSMAMLPEEQELGVHARSYVTAGLLELMQRRWMDSWDDDLESKLLP